MQFQNKISKHFPLLIAICIALNAMGLFLDIIEPDGALYASISKNIITTNNWWFLYGSGGEWLDKPHFPFWLAAISIKIFGINSFAYKLPNFICFLLSIYYLYKLATRVCCKQTAEIATLIYATSLHILLCNFDVRAEIFLTCFCAASIYHLLLAQSNTWHKNIAIAALYAACAIMCKGIFVLITIGGGLVFYWIFVKDYKQFISLKWYVFALLTLVFIAPELYSLYVQFDAHPEKIVFGKTNVSGLKFFFWDSQFGRFFNTGPIQGSGDKSFFLHTTLWAFLPWSFFLILAIYSSIKSNLFKILNEKKILYFSAIITFLIFSFSKFQLPHYIIIIFPYLSITVGHYLVTNTKLSNIKLFNAISMAMLLLIETVVIVIAFIYNFKYKYLLLGFTIICDIFFFYFEKKDLLNFIKKQLVVTSLISVFLFCFLYPNLLDYQAGMQAAKWTKSNNIKDTIYQYHCNDYCFDYYGNSPIHKNKNLREILEHKEEAKFIAYDNAIESVNVDSFNIEKIKSFPYYHITELKFSFINEQTRASTLSTLFLLKIKRKY